MICAAKNVGRLSQLKKAAEKAILFMVPPKPGEGVLETDKPSFKRIVLPDPRRNDEAGFRSVVAEVAKHHGVQDDEILATMMAEIEKEVMARKGSQNSLTDPKCLTATSRPHGFVRPRRGFSAIVGPAQLHPGFGPSSERRSLAQSQETKVS